MYFNEDNVIVWTSFLPFCLCFSCVGSVFIYNLPLSNSLFLFWEISSLKYSFVNCLSNSVMWQKMRYFYSLNLKLSPASAGFAPWLPPGALLLDPIRGLLWPLIPHFQAFSFPSLEYGNLPELQSSKEDGATKKKKQGPVAAMNCEIVCLACLHCLEVTVPVDFGGQSIFNLTY